MSNIPRISEEKSSARMRARSSWKTGTVEAGAENRVVDEGCDVYARQT